MQAEIHRVWTVRAHPWHGNEIAPELTTSLAESGYGSCHLNGDPHFFTTIERLTVIPTM